VFSLSHGNDGGGGQDSREIIGLHIDACASCRLWFEMECSACYVIALTTSDYDISSGIEQHHDPA